MFNRKLKERNKALEIELKTTKEKLIESSDRYYAITKLLNEMTQLLSEAERKIDRLTVEIDGLKKRISEDK